MTEHGDPETSLLTSCSASCPDRTGSGIERNVSGRALDVSGMVERKLIDVVTETVAITVLDLDGTSAAAGGDAKVGGGLPHLSDALDTIEDFAASLRDKLAVAQPTKTTCRPCPTSVSTGAALRAGSCLSAWRSTAWRARRSSCGGRS